MVDLRQSALAPRELGARERVAALAGAQAGRVSRAQLSGFGVADSQIGRWAASGLLIRVLPRIYAAGHVAPSLEGDLYAALLYAGPGAMLSHLAAAWWIGIVDRLSFPVSLSTSRRCRSTGSSSTAVGT